MEIALFNLMPLTRRGDVPAEVLAHTVAMVRLAEELDFDIAWFAEHHVASFGLCPSPLLMSAHCAAVTRRIRLGPAVIVLPLYNPIRLLEEIGFVEALSPGRLALAFGNGHQPQEFRSLGIDVAARHELAAEIWDVIDQGLRDGHVAFAGKHLQIPPTELAIRPAAMPPRYLAAGDPLLVARAARGDVIPFISQAHRDLPEALALREALVASYRRAGDPRDPLPVAVQRFLFVTESRDEARRAAQDLLDLVRKIRSLRDEWPARDGLHIRSVPFAGEPSVEWLLEHGLIGDPARCAERLVDEVAALRPCHMSFFMGFAGLEPKQLRRSLELFGTVIVPRLRAATGGRPDRAPIAPA
jgi:alkanesulfonate monooxygenase SsuD/methylene tetrahydromethanopterin reductase-like flavin-dependent oxidoreductase (luciferase family)